MGKTTKKVIISVFLLFVVSTAAFFYQDQIKQLADNFRYGKLCKNCNVILISVDTLRADHMGTYGYKRDTTPNIDSFFKDKSIFNNAITPAPCTYPAVLQYLTGLFVYRQEDKRIAEVLKLNGYNTAAIVSQHTFGSKEMPLKEYSRGFDLFDIQPMSQVDQHRMTARRATEVSDRAVNWLEGNFNKRPFFLWLHFFDPHDPYSPPEEFRDYREKSSIYINGDRRSALQKAQLADKDQKEWKVIQKNFGYIRDVFWRLYGHIFSENDVKNFIGLYDGEIQYTDFEVGRILDKLGELDLVDDSVIILTSDHGEELGENNVWDHCLTLHEREIHVPLLMSVRGSGLGGYRNVYQPVSTLDIFPTVLSLTGLPSDSYKFDGIDLFKLSPDRKVFSGWENSTIIRDGKWKFYTGANGNRLFNLDNDGKEDKNMINENREIAEELYGELNAFLASKFELNRQYKEVVKKLKSLGYIN